jgi:biopolymer transport protein ExbB
MNRRTPWRAAWWLVLGLAALALAATPKQELETKQKELALVRGHLETMRDSLEREIADRWRAKQTTVEQREADKLEQERLREQQERAYAELGRLKEAGLIREKQLEEEKKNLLARQDDWKLVGNSVDDLIDREVESITEHFPLDVESHRKKLEAIRREFRRTTQVIPALRDLFRYYDQGLTAGRAITLGQETILPAGGRLETVSLARYGDVFAYGLNADGELFYIRQTGNLGAGRYAAEKIELTALRDNLQRAFPRWIQAGTPAGAVPVDVMQNNQTKIILSGKKSDLGQRVREFFRAGGPVMFPLALISVWALVLIVLKLVQFSRKHKANLHIYQDVERFLETGRIDEALAYVKNIRSVVARVVQTCLEHSKWKRDTAEKAVREILVEEVPLLNKYLSTLAVIAGAAPLLGLLGTVTGMISLFEVITHYGTGDPKIMAGGISEALVTTEVGLIIAIPVLLCHNYLRNRRDHIMAEMEKHAIRILNRLWVE